MEDVNEASMQLTAELLRVSKACIPNKMVTVRPDDKPWFTNELRKLLRQKKRVHSQAKVINTPELWGKFRELRNTYCREIAKCKLEFKERKYTHLFSNNNLNDKKWWHVLKETLGQTSSSQFPPMNRENEIIVDNKEKAEAFNNFFAEASDIDDTNHQLPADNMRAPNQLDHIEISETDVSDQIQILNVNKAYGPDELPPRILKEANAFVSKPLAKLFNKSLQTLTFPSIWKRANVLPVFKKGAQNILGNYRPISLLSINSKIFEKIIFKYVYNHFKDNFLISIWQSGFQPSMSTVTQLTELYHQFCKAVSDGKEIRVVFLDISKAFDRVWHKGLLFKLKDTNHVFCTHFYFNVLKGKRDVT